METVKSGKVCPVAAKVPKPVKCPFARRPGMTGCDCDCDIPPPRGFWARMRWLFGPKWCISGPGGRGDGWLPCKRFDEWRKDHEG